MNRSFGRVAVTLLIASCHLGLAGCGGSGEGSIRRNAICPTAVSCSAATAAYILDRPYRGQCRCRTPTGLP